MPYLKIETNVKLDGGFVEKASAFCAEIIGKPEKWVMARVDSGVELMHSGTDEPAAFVELKSIGLPVEACKELSEKMCGFLEQEAGISPHHVYIEFKDLTRSLFGWNRGTF